MLDYLKPLRPLSEKVRQAAVDRLNLRSPPQHELKPILKEVANVFGASTAVAMIIDKERAIVCSHHNPTLTETHRDDSFCGHTILNPGRVMIVWNAATDPRFANNPLVRGEPNIRFYAGAPILSADGQPIGTLCHR